VAQPGGGGGEEEETSCQRHSLDQARVRHKVSKQGQIRGPYRYVSFRFATCNALLSRKGSVELIDGSAGECTVWVERWIHLHVSLPPRARWAVGYPIILRRLGMGKEGGTV